MEVPLEHAPKLLKVQLNHRASRGLRRIVGPNDIAKMHYQLGLQHMRFRLGKPKISKDIPAAMGQPQLLGGRRRLHSKPGCAGDTTKAW